MTRPPSLPSKRDFERVLRTGTRTRARAGTFFVAPAPEASAPARLGLAVPARAGGAVVRNRIKRRLRASFMRASLPPGFDVVVRATPDAARLDFQELESSFTELPFTELGGAS